MRKMIYLSAITLGFIFSMDMLASLSAEAADADKPNMAAKSQAQKTPLELRWNLAEEKSLNYNFEQRVEITSNVGPATKPPIQINGQLRLKPFNNPGEISLILDATRQDLQQAATQSKVKPESVKRPVEEKKTAPRSFFSCRPAEPKEPVVQKPKTAPTPAATPKMHARFVIGPKGLVRGDGASTGGQTELMMRLLFPLPQKALAIGKEESSQVDVSPVGRRFPMMGKRLLKIEEIVDIHGQRCARIMAKVTMSGEGRGQHKPGQTGQMKGKMKLTAMTRGLFAIDAGYFLEAQSELDFSLDTERIVHGQSQKISLKQHQSSAIVLHKNTEEIDKSKNQADEDSLKKQINKTH